MSNRLGTAATIATSVVTLAVLLYVATGPALSIVMLLVSGVAFAVWMRDDQHRESTTAIVPYLSVVVISLLLSAVRYWSGYASHVAMTLPAVFAPHYASADVTWFVATVTVPVSLMLLGGYAWWRGERRGRWVIVAAVVATLLGLAMGLLPDWFVTN